MTPLRLGEFKLSHYPEASWLAPTLHNRYNNRFCHSIQNFSFGVPMSFRRVGWLAATALATLVCISCGQVYRPVVIPVSTTPPNPENFHAVFGLSANVGGNPGTVLQIDVSGDSNIGVANMGLVPTHVAALPTNNRVFVASAGSVCVEDPSVCPPGGVFPGGADIITAFTPAASSPIATGLGSPAIYSLPNVGPQQSAAITSISESGTVVTAVLAAPIGQAKVGGTVVIAGVNIGGYDGSFVISTINGSTIQYSDPISGLISTTGGTATVPLPTFCSYQPDFVATTQTTAVYVANYGVENGPNCTFASTDSVAQLSSSANAITNIAYLNPSNASPAPHPVAMVETPNAQNLYVVNQGNNTILDLSPIDLSTLATIPVGSTPVWAVARPDNRRVYVVTQGAGTLVPIDVATNTILQTQTNLSVGAGANLVVYDPTLNRLYVTNPATGYVFVYSATGGVDLSGNANDTPKLLATISMSAGANPPCPSGCAPVGVAALPDGSRFYVASYNIEATCSDANVGPTACIVPMLTVFDAASMTAKPVPTSLLAPTPSLSLLVSPPYALNQYALPPVPSCVTPATYSPGTTRFRMFTTASADSSHVYVSICDSGSIADVATNTNSVTSGANTPDSLVTDIAAPFGACTPGTCGSTAVITQFSITNNVVTLTANNNFIAGQQVQISGLSSPVGTGMNGKTLTVLQGVTPTQFQCNFAYPTNVGPTNDSGTAVSIPSATITSFSIGANNVATFQAINTFTPGTKVSISGLASSAGTQLNGLAMTVIATGLTNAQFEAVATVTLTTTGSTTDTGIAVPIVQPQSPVFLLTGQ